jgi:hypothetical protein
MNKVSTKPLTNLRIPLRETGGEKLLQFIWQFGYFNQHDLQTTDGEKITILSPGTLNKNGGPDFSAAKIKLGETTFFGSVELHLRTSDWEKHQHTGDRQYGNVILHVVFQHDKILPHAIPVLALEPRISTLLLDRYFSFMNAEKFIPCHPAYASVKEIVWSSWKERLLVERLTRKAVSVLELLQQSNGHWEETLWWLLARNFGGKVNGDAFEAIARSLPVNVLAKHKTSIHQLEALLFGQAGLLTYEFADDYPQLLQREYAYLQKKLSLKRPVLQLQFLRMRPQNFPTIRLAQLAGFLHQSSHLFSKIVEAGNVESLRKEFDVTANDYWHYHYTFQQPSVFRKKAFGNDSIDNLFINTVIPVLFAYGLFHQDDNIREKAVRWLEQIRSEKNSITKEFAAAGISLVTAFDSQALIELRNQYCSPKRCLECAVGNNLLKRETTTSTGC